MDKKSPSFPLSYESDGAMGKRPARKQSTKKETKQFFNTTPSSE